MSDRRVKGDRCCGANDFHRRDSAILLGIAKAVRKIPQCKQGLDKAAFLADEKTQSAIVFQLLIVGEVVEAFHP